MLHKHNTIYIHLVLLLVLLFCLPILAQQQSVSTSNNSAAALGKAKQPDAPSAIAERFFNGMNAGDKFGTAVSSAGDVNGDGYGDVIVGADGNNGNTGKAYIFFGGNIINNMPDVTLTGEAFGDRFGYSVSTAGDVNGDGYSDVIVGAYVNGSFTGKSYLYFGSYTISGNITASNADVTMTGEATSNFFGYSVSSAGDVNGDGYSDVIVGAYGNTINTGKSYIYFGGSTMNPTANVTLTGEVTGDRFGISVSSTGDVNGDGYSDVIVGAFGNSSFTGKSYIYLGGSTMNSATDVTMSGEAVGDQLGYSVSTAGDVNGDGYSDVIVGAFGNSSSTGKSYIYFGSSIMNSSPNVTMTGEFAGDRFGYSVSNGGDVNGDGYNDVIVGADKNDAGGSDAGRSYIYYGASSMDNIVDVTTTGKNADDRFGFSVSTAGDMNADGYDDFIVGAYFNDINGSNSGRAYLYLNSLTGSDIADDFFSGEAATDFFGLSVSTAGDVNGDGYSDVIVGAANNNNSSTGKSYIYFGGPNIDNIADVTMIGEATSDGFGNSVSTAGDVNGDGYSDIIVGANTINGFTGKSYIFFGGSSISGNINASSADVTMTGEATNNYFGVSVSSAGDVNGDGYSDVIVGTNLKNSSYIFFGSSTIGGNINASSANVTMTGEATNNFGGSVSNAGDVNGDGYSDVIVGAYLNDAGGSDAGKSYIFFGGSSMTGNIAASNADVTMTGEASGDWFGLSVSAAGDVNGDGFSDVIVGTYRKDSFTGKSYIYFGGSSISGNINASSADVTMIGEATNNYFGRSVSSAGDVNGDGYSDVIVGASRNDFLTGKSYIYFGGSSMNSFADVTMTGEPGSGYFGRTVSSAGDVNGDGYSDIVVGAYGKRKSYLYISSSPPIKPRIASVKDVPGDQGSYATVKWVRSGYDAQGMNRLDKYIVQRSTPPQGSGFAWETIANIEPTFQKYYLYTANTWYDSTANSSGTVYYRVLVRGVDGNELWTSNILYGHSVDNLAPGAPLGFAANSSGNNTVLHWHPNTENDLYNYILYRSSTPTIDLNTASPIANVTDTLFTDTNPPTGEVYYFIVAQDIHNNLSPLATDDILSLAIVDVKIFLEGAYSTPSMTTSLTVPTTSPYTDALTVASIPANVVDWVWVELRNKIDPTILESSRSAFVLSSGKVVDTDGSSTVSFFGVSDTQYYIVVKHRNHLGVMSTTPVNVN